ncbi:FAD-binding oxidoreductase [Amylibacter sp. SFDW26]|uniref:NAD(P)/FAD-dependent oxidoreductase n=1 Tax=Amylibacter sp. SFDW26 TaxID=2652722 RepID=UPI0012629750|nr:FAD-dependent oxidoreductase [Amylibacter sp. SFDW26]KAB7614340.1 FAD-binding oxidoreductase [Amylibacter sp. SFDW26]
MPKEWDVIVIGAGVWGLSCAYACAKRGQSVAVFEAGTVGQGASGGIVGAMAPHAPDSWNEKKQFQFEALDSAERFWAEVDVKSGLQSGYGRIGRIIPITTERDRELAEERREIAKTVFLGKYKWNVLESHPMLPSSTTPYGVVHDEITARIYPAKAVVSLAKACQNLGVEIIENRRVTGFDDHTVFGAWGEARADAIIIAGGTEGFALLDYHLGCNTGVGVKGQAALLDYDMGDVPQIYANGVYIIPHIGGVTTIGATSEKTWGQPFEIDDKLDVILDKAYDLMPALKEAHILQRWAGLRPKARRRHPMLGPIPEVKGVYSAMGAYTVGFGIAHKVGEVLADYAGGGSFDLPRNFTVDWQME